MPQVLNSSHEELVQKAQELFWVKGFKGVSVQELSDYLEVSKSTIYNKYSKESLFIDSLEYYTATYSDPFLKQLRETTEGKESLRGFFYSLIDALVDKTFPKSCLTAIATASLPQTPAGQAAPLDVRGAAQRRHGGRACFRQLGVCQVFPADRQSGGAGRDLRVE